MLFGAEVAAEYPRASATQAGMPGLSEPLPRAVWGTVRGLFVRDRPDARVGGDPEEGTDKP
jgi:hypothetical protein